ncbi:ectoine hydroxylase [Marinimicrobium koreense]|uniref:Ectoine hydroxylase n=1 Tax=Marinimicrobium koreense TaxID=306545 RepID=A0A3N1NUE1_9GAMM|nr:ectoine hydroxylase [Marinimicrobium koreense]
MLKRYDPYPSRTGDAEQIIPRTDPVIYGAGHSDRPQGLSREQLAHYEQKGFLTLPGLMDDRLDTIRAEADTLKTTMAGREELYTEPDSGELRTIFKPHAYSETIARIARDPRILEPVKQILGSDVYLTQSRINRKPAFKGRSFAWHSDFETWHVEDGMRHMRAVTAWIMLTDNHEYNGPLYVIPGSHKHYVSCAGTTEEKNYRKSLKKQVAGVPGKESLETLLKDHTIEGVYGKAGTLVLHECNILHGSPDNISGDPRALLMFVYNSVENELEQPFSGQAPRPHYLADREPKVL